MGVNPKGGGGSRPPDFGLGVVGSQGVVGGHLESLALSFVVILQIRL